uniref:Uncharacterized protein n=1 Tax=Arundo donax TaxID=35708 RepID=A0A0A9B823_ARUDO
MLSMLKIWKTQVKKHIFRRKMMTLLKPLQGINHILRKTRKHGH